jgi:hypothetical protein
MPERPEPSGRCLCGREIPVKRLLCAVCEPKAKRKRARRARGNLERREAARAARYG